MQNKLKIRLLALVCLVTLAGCSGSNGGSSTNSSVHDEDKLNIPVPLYMDALGVAPTHGSYTINVNNIGDDHYTLESITVTDAHGNDQSGIIKVAGAMCQRLTAKNSCSIEFTPRTAKSAAVVITVKLKNSKGVIETVRQMIRISDKLGGTKGLSFEPELGNVVTASGDYSISIPVVLNEDFDKVEAFNGSLSCNSVDFKKGSACTYLISGHALADNTTVSAQLVGYKNKKEVSRQLNNITLRTGNMANLILAPDVSITGDGTTTSDIMVYNTGNASATEVAYNKNLAEIELSSATCSNIAAAKACAITAKAISETHASGYIEASYKPTTEAATRTAGANVTIIGSTNYGLTLSSNDSLEDTLVGEHGEYNLTIENKAKNKLSNLRYSLLNPGSGMSLSPHACPSEFAGGAAPCTLKVVYEPQDAHIGANAEILISASYVGTMGEIKTYQVKRTIRYSAIATTNVLAITKPHDLHVIINEAPENGGVDSATATISRTIAGSLGVKLTELEFTTPVDGLRLDTSEAEACKVNNILTELNPTCTAHINYGPITTSSAASSTHLSAGYTFGKNDTRGSAQSLAFTATASEAHAKVGLYGPVKMDRGGYDVSGDGSLTTPYKFTALSKLEPMHLTYTFKNTGNVDALNFSLNKGSIQDSFPIGVKVKSNECSPNAGSTRTLKKNETCTLIVEVPDKEFLFQSDIANTSSTVIPQNAAIKLPFSLNYTDVGNNYYDEAESTQHVQFNRNWAGMKYETTEIIKADGKWHIKIKATAAAIDSHFPITIEPLTESATHMADAENVTTCTIENETDNTCNVSFDLDVNKHHAEDDNFIVTMEVKNSGLANDIIHDNHVVAYSDALATVNVTQMWDHPKFKGIISHGAGESLAFAVAFKRPISSSTLHASAVLDETSLTQGLSVESISNSCPETDATADTCTISGYIKLPKMTTAEPVPYNLALSMTLAAKDAGDGGADNVLSYSIKESGQIVMSFNNSGDKINEKDRSSLNYFPLQKWYYGIVVHNDDVLLDGPTVAKYSVAGTKSSSAITINALNYNDQSRQKLTVYVSRYNGSQYRALGDNTPGGANDLEILRMSTAFLKNSPIVYQSIGENHYKVYSSLSNPQPDLNTDVPPGRYIATFYLLRQGQPIKIDLDWTKR